MRKILIQLDSDPHPSPFDAIVAYDAGVDVVLGYGAVTPAAVRNLVQGAFFTRGVRDLATLAVWVGGSRVPAGEEILAEVRKAYFGPFRVSAMLDSNGCNTTAATAIAMIAKQIELAGKRAVIIGAGPVGLRSASLLARAGCEVVVSSIPPELFGDERPHHRPAGIAIAREMGLTVAEPGDRQALLRLLDGAAIALCSGPTGVRILRRQDWAQHPTLEILGDYNAAEPLGIEGVKADDAFARRDGKLVLGALAIGDRKMRVHKTCIARLFEQNDLILNIDGVYEVAAGVA